MKAHLKGLLDQTVAITGASSGIGLATARLAAGRRAIDTRYVHHAKNYLPMQPQNPPLLCAPEVAA